ncbi:putative leader peptide [uncultured Jatrophihabitans sp.]
MALRFPSHTLVLTQRRHIDLLRVTTAAC